MPRMTGNVAAGVDTARVEAAVIELLHAIGEDPSRQGLLATPSRVGQAYSEFFSGVGVDPLIHLQDAQGMARLRPRIGAGHCGEPSP